MEIVAKVTFGAEPKDYDVQEYIHKYDYHRLGRILKLHRKICMED